MLRPVLAVAVFLSLNGCKSNTEPFKQVIGGIEVYPKEGGARIVRVTPYSNSIFRVVATPEDACVDSASLVVLNQFPSKVDFNVSSGEGAVTISTSELSARVDLTSGAVSFLDPSGNVLLQEQANGGKTFESVSLKGKSLYQVRQVFDSPDDEAFYGLGQHQHGLMNYKGKDVELAQHNIVAVVPFLYSTKGYGMLWDNYSITRFGDPRAYASLSTIDLYDKNGKPGGLTATYRVADSVKYEKVESEISFEYLETPQLDTFPKDVAQRGSVTWEGTVGSKTPGQHKFLLYGSGYFKLWIDDELIMDKWRQNWNPWSNQFTIDIAGDEKHSFKLEWLAQGGYMAVKHLDPLPGNEQQQLSLFSEAANQIDYYFVKGEKADEVIAGYRALTGKASLVPKWATGFWQSRERYKTQDELLGVVREFRKNRIPLDNIVLDWNYWPEDKWGSHEFDLARFPDAKGMVDELHNTLHTNIMISVWPKFYPGVDNFDEMQKNGYLFEHNLEKKRIDWIAQGYQNTFYDPFNPGARKMFWDQIDRRLNSKGFDAWWLDATEPDMHSNLSIEERKLNMTPSALGSGVEYFNAYSLMNSRGVYEGQRASSPDKRVFILTRSAFAGQQRYGSVTWSGDIVTRWSDLRDQISAGVNFSLSGIPFWTMDIGGFAVENRFGAYGPAATKEDLDEWRELNARWFQFGTFCPLFRVHGQYPFREMFNLAPKDHALYKSQLFYDKLRYRLMPYVYSLAGQAAVDDGTLMRGLVMDFKEDKQVFGIDDAYMFGPALLVAPVHEYKARTRKVYLPASAGWYDFYSGKYYEGGQTLDAAAPLERMPLFVKAGSIVPAGPEIQYTTEKPSDPITLYVFTGADGSFALYEDEGTNYNYEKKEYSKIPFTYNEATGTLTIGKREGTFTGMLDKRTFHMVWVKREAPVGIGLTATPHQVVQYTGDQIEVKMK